MRKLLLKLWLKLRLKLWSKLLLKLRLIDCQNNQGLAAGLYTSVLMILWSVSIDKAYCDEPSSAKIPPFHHVVDLLIPQSVKIPDDFPTELNLSGKATLVCATCHAMDGIESLSREQIDQNHPGFLRQGPYPELSDFCYRCHQRQSNRANNIHQILPQDSVEQVKQRQCLYCHRQLPEDNKPDHQGALYLRISMEKICWGCHLRTPHLNAIEHQGVMKDEMMHDFKKRQKKHAISMPLGDDNRILCITCHDPHQADAFNILEFYGPKRVNHPLISDDLSTGVSYQESPWNAVYRRDKSERLQRLNQTLGQSYDLQYGRIKQEVLLRLPAKSGTLCLVCHSF